MKKRLFISLLLSIGLFAGYRGYAVDLAAPYVALGMTNLQNQDLISANSNFENAVSVEPEYAPANFLYAATRLLVLTQSPAGSNFLNGLGVAATGRSYYDWTALPETNSAGKPQFPAGYNSGTAIAFYTNTLMPAITASLTNLANITDTNFQLLLPAAITTGGAYPQAFGDAQSVTADYGDVQMMRSLLTTAEFFGYTLSGNNADADLSWIETNIENKTLTIQSLLNQFPSLASRQNTAAITESEKVGTNAIELYFGAANFILYERTDTNAIFTLSTNEIPAEIEFQTDLTNILLALTEPTQFASNNVGSTIYLAPYFDGNVSFRSLFPKFNGDAYVPNSVPDYTFGGMLPDLPAYETESLLTRKFPNYAGIYTGDGGLYDNLIGYNGSFAVYVSTNGQLTVIGYDPGDEAYYTNNNSYTVDGTDFGVLVQATLENGGNWQTSNSAYNAYGGFNDVTNFYGEIDYSNGESVYLNATLASPVGPYQNSAGYYTGSFTGSPSGSLYAIAAADGEIYFTTGQSGPGGNDGGSSQFYNSDNDFGTLETDGSEVYGIINTNAVSVEGTNYFTDPNTGTVTFYSRDLVSPGYIEGIYTNVLNDASGTFTLSRSSGVVGELPPMITTNLFSNWTVPVGSETTFRFAASGSLPLTYQWYINGNPVPGVTSGTLVMSNVQAGSFTISATVQNAVGETNSQGCSVTVVPQVPTYPGIYLGNAPDDVSDSEGYYNGAFAAYVSTAGQVTIVGQDDGDGTDDGNDFGFVIQTPLVNGGFQYNNSYVSVNGYIDTQGDFNAQLYYPQANGGFGESVSLYGNLESSVGPFQNSDGLYSGTFAGTDSSGNVDFILDPNGNYFLVPLNSNGNASQYGNAGIGAFGQFFSSTQFSTTTISATLIAGTLNPSTFVISGIYTNSNDNSLGIFKVSRSGAGPAYLPPTITADLPNSLTIPLGNTATFHLGATGTAPLNYQWYLNGNPITGATASTLAISNNVWTTPGLYNISAVVYNVLGETNSQNCGVTVLTETNIPTVTITAPTPGQLWSNSVFTVTGTASDKLGITNVVCTVNGTLVAVNPNPSYNNWSAVATLNPGSNTISAYSINDGLINSKMSTVLMDYVVTSPLTVITNGEGTINPVYAAPLRVSQPFTLTAAGINGFRFVSWYIGTNEPLSYYTNNPTVSLTMSNGLIAEANLEDTNQPYLKITNATMGMVWSNETFTVMGVATDDEAIASVNYSFNNGPYTNAATNGIQWSSALLSLTAGTNVFSVYAQATNGNFSATDTVDIVYLATYQLTVQTSGKGTISPDYSNALLYVGRQYSMTASADSGFKFINWTAETNLVPGGVSPAISVPGFALYSTNATANFTMQTGLVMQANFKDLNPPYLSITNMLSQLVTNSGTFTVMGVATDDEQMTFVTYSFNGSATNAVYSTDGWTNWSQTLALQAGTNVFAVFATATNGNMATDTVKIVSISTNQLTLQTSGKGTISPNYSNAWLDCGINYSMTATPASGFKFINWTGTTNGAYVLYGTNPAVTFMMQTGLVMQANFKDLNPPYLRITNMLTQLITNSGSFTPMGVATDDEQMTFVTYSFNGSPTNEVYSTDGWTNWSQALALQAGTNVFSVYATATNGNMATDTVKIVSISTNQLTLQTSGKGTFSPNYSNAWLDCGINYSVTASPASGFKFINWTGTTNGAFVLYGTNSALTFMMQTGLIMQANFKDLNPPYLRITNMLTQLITNSGSFTPMGVATDDEQMTFVTYSFNGSATNAVYSTDGWTNWSQALALQAGTNVFSVYATATNGNMATDTVKIVSISTNQLTLQTSGKGTISPNYSNVWLDCGINYSMTASPASGFKFINWTGTTNGAYVLYGTNPAVTFMMQTGLVMQANFKDLNPPYLRITNMLTQLITNSGSFTPLGVATDDEQMTFVTYSFNGSATNAVYSTDGWTNWSQTLALEAGTNVFSVYATATNGNVATDTVKIVSISTNQLTLQTSGKGTISPNYSNAWLDCGINYSMTATPASGFKFINWTGTTNGAYVLYGTNPGVTFMMQTGLVMQANFKDLNPPYLRITNMLSQLITNSGSFTVMGVATDDEQMTFVTYSLNGSPTNEALSGNGWTNWSQTLALDEGTNVFSVYATATNGNMATNTLTIIRQPTILTFLIATNPAITHPQAQLAFDGTNYLVVYQQGGAMGQFVSTNGDLVDLPLQLNPGGSDDPPYLDFDGTNYLVAWVDYSDPGTGVPVKGAFVSPGGAVSPVAQLSQSTTVKNFGAIVYGGGVYLVLWVDDRTTPDSIYGEFVTPAGTTNGEFLVSSDGTGQEVAGPAAAFDGTNFLAVWSTATNNLGINGQLISSSSGPLGNPFVIYTNSTTPAGFGLPSVVFDGTNYLVLVNSGVSKTTSASSFHLLGRFVTTGGDVLTNQVSLTTDAGPQFAPGVDFDAINFVASWDQGWNPFSLGSSGVINGRFLNSQGNPTTAEFPIFTAPPGGHTWTFAPVLFDGSKFVLVGGAGLQVKAAGSGALTFTNGAIYGAFVSP